MATERGARTPRWVGLDHVQLAAPPGCEEEARRFYGELLGLAELPKPANLAARGGVWFRCGAQELYVGVQRDFVPATKAYPALRTEDLEALRERLVAHGVAVVDDEPLEGVRRCYVSTPSGTGSSFSSASVLQGSRRARSPAHASQATARVPLRCGGGSTPGRCGLVAARSTYPGKGWAALLRAACEVEERSPG